MYDRTATVTRCLDTVFKYADLLCKINQHSIAKVAAEDDQEATDLQILDEICM